MMIKDEQFVEVSPATAGNELFSEPLGSERLLVIYCRCDCSGRNCSMYGHLG